jgi:regulator of replication initiation timing
MRTWKLWMLLFVLGAFLVNPALTLAQADPTPTAQASAKPPTAEEVAALKTQIKTLKADLKKTKERRNYYQDRVVELKEENAKLHARIDELEAAAVTPEPTPTAVPDTGMTPDELAYLLASRDIIGGAYVTLLAAQDITSRFDFSENVSLWYDLIDTLQPFRTYWFQIQQLIPPPRLADLHQVYLDILYNGDQAATNIEFGVNNLNADSIYTAIQNLQAMTDATNRAGPVIAAYEREADVDISEELPPGDLSDL